MGQGSSKGYHYIFFSKTEHSWDFEKLVAGITVLLGYRAHHTNTTKRGFHWWDKRPNGVPIMPVTIEERDFSTVVGVYNKLQDPSIIQTIRHWHDHGYVEPE